MSNRNRTRLPRRVFLQPGGPGFNPLDFQGLDTQDIAITGVKRERRRGSGNETYVPDPQNAGGYKLSAVTYDPPARGEFTLEMLELDDGSIPAQFLDHDCLNAYVLGGECGDLSDFNKGWRGYVEIFSDAEQDDAADMGDRTSLDGDEMLKSSLAMKAKHIYAVGELNFTDILDGVTADGVSDVIVSAPRKCSGCSNPKRYDYDVYILDVGATKQVLARKHGGATVVAYPLPSHNYESDAKMAIVGGKLVIPFSEASSGSGDGGYVYAPINEDGSLGGFVTVNAGLGASIGAVYALNRRAFMLHDGGASPAAWRFFANVGDANSIVALTNARQSAASISGLFVTTSGNDVVYTRDGVKFYTAAATGATLASNVKLAIVDADTWYVLQGVALYRTDDGGKSWRKRELTNDMLGDDVFMAFATREVGYIYVGDEGGAHHLFATWSGGQNWTDEGPRVNNIGADYFKAKALGVPQNADGIVKDANYVIIAYSNTSANDTHVMEGAATFK